MLTKAMQQFFQSPEFAVVGASAAPEKPDAPQKPGYKAVVAYLGNGKKVHPIHPTAVVIENLHVLRSVADLPPAVQSISIITGPAVTKETMDKLIANPGNITNIWFQPGSVNTDDLAKYKEANNLNIICGPCVIETLNAELKAAQMAEEIRQDIRFGFFNNTTTALRLEYKFVFESEAHEGNPSVSSIVKNMKEIYRNPADVKRLFQELIEGEKRAHNQTAKIYHFDIQMSGIYERKRVSLNASVNSPAEFATLIASDTFAPFDIESPYSTKTVTAKS